MAARSTPLPVRDSRGRFAKRETGQGVGPFPDAVCVHTWDDGMRLARMMTRTDLAILTKNGGGCSSDHWYWVENGKTEFFFVIVKAKADDQDYGSRVVGPILFCKRLEFFAKPHPAEDEWAARHGLRREGYSLVWDDDHQPPIVKVKAWDGRLVNQRKYVRIPTPPWGWISSAHYDHGYETPAEMAGNGNRYYVEDCRYYLDNAKRHYDLIKAEAIRSHGPLGKDHPMKQQVDDANKEVARCQGALDKAKKGAVIASGRTFTFEGTELFIVQYAGPGVDYGGSNSRYTDRLHEWLGEEVAIGK